MVVISIYLFSKDYQAFSPLHILLLIGDDYAHHFGKIMLYHKKNKQFIHIDSIECASFLNYVVSVVENTKWLAHYLIDRKHEYSPRGG